MSGIFINEDFGNFFFNDFSNDCFFPALPTNEEGLRKHIDYYAQPGVEALIFNLNAMRGMFDCRSRDAIWDGLEQGEDGKYYFLGKEVGVVHGHSQIDLASRCRDLYRNVPDVQGFRYRYCHEKGIKMFISMRMNDIHWVDHPDNISHSSFWREHPEYRRALFKKDYSFWFSQCLDYGMDVVREYQMKLVREYFERFDMDGFELDWMRSPFHFRPGEEDRGRVLLNHFMEEVNRLRLEAEQRRGHRIPLMVRVHAFPEEAYEGGLDVVTWARRNYVDWVVPSSYYAATDGATPIELWKMLLPEQVKLAPGLECKFSNGHTRYPVSPEVNYGFAASFYHKGADAIYLFNHMQRYTGYVGEERRRQPESFSILSDREKTEAQVRRHVATQHEPIVEGMCNMPGFEPHIRPHESVAVRINAGGKTESRKALIILGSQSENAEKNTRVFLNSRECRLLPEMPSFRMPDDIKFFCCYEVPECVLHDGGNQVDLLNEDSQKVDVSWVEIILI